MTESQAKARFDRDVAVVAGYGIAVVQVGSLHTKALIGDRQVYCLGSFNWLSARRHPSARHETSMVYRGHHLADEIDRLLGDLSDRRIDRPDGPSGAPVRARSRRHAGDGRR